MLFELEEDKYRKKIFKLVGTQSVQRDAKDFCLRAVETCALRNDTESLKNRARSSVLRRLVNLYHFCRQNF